MMVGKCIQIFSLIFLMTSRGGGVKGPTGGLFTIAMFSCQSSLIPVFWLWVVSPSVV